MATSVGAALLDEIARVSELKGRYESLRGRPGVNVDLVIALMDLAIEEAKKAVIGDDPVEAINALAELRGFTE